MEDKIYEYHHDEHWKFMRDQKMAAVADQTFEIAADWRDKEVKYVLEKYGINITTKR